MRVVITGATGNIGSALVESLDRDPEVREVVGVARHPPARETARPGLSYLAADVSRHVLVDAFRGADCVVHLAWRLQPAHDPRELERTNVEGTERVCAAVQAAGVGALVVASSVGAYSPRPEGADDRPVDETWPTGGIATSTYSLQKARVERLLDRLEAEGRVGRVVRIRPAVALQRSAAAEIKRLFVGPLVPRRLFDRRVLQFLPGNPRLRLQAVHTPDLADAFRRAVLRPVRGAFNVAAEPPLDAASLSEVLGRRRLTLPVGLMRGAVDLTWRLHLQPTDVGWFDMARQSPLMDAGRARRELGWEPRTSALEALLEVLQGIREGEGSDRPPLDGGQRRAS